MSRNKWCFCFIFGWTTHLTIQQALKCKASHTQATIKIRREVKKQHWCPQKTKSASLSFRTGYGALHGERRPHYTRSESLFIYFIWRAALVIDHILLFLNTWSMADAGDWSCLFMCSRESTLLCDLYQKIHNYTRFSAYTGHEMWWRSQMEICVEFKQTRSEEPCRIHHRVRSLKRSPRNTLTYVLSDIRQTKNQSNAQISPAHFLGKTFPNKLQHPQVKSLWLSQLGL